MRCKLLRRLGGHAWRLLSLLSLVWLRCLLCIMCPLGLLCQRTLQVRPGLDCIQQQAEGVAVGGKPPLTHAPVGGIDALRQ